MTIQELEQHKPTAYDQDFFAWAMDTAKLLRAGRFAEVDVAHVAEELESLGKSEKRELVSRLTVLLAHLLKWKYQPVKRTRSWRNTILTQRMDIQELLTDSPSLRSILEQSIAIAYKKAVLYAENETDMDTGTFPAVCPFTYEEILNKDFPTEGE